MLDDDALKATSRRTLAHYNAHADDFWEGTRDHDVTQNYAALLDNLPGPGPYRILDLGCGPGRDLRWFRDRGHEAVGLDGAERFVAMARRHSGCEVLHQDFLALSLPAEHFDGVFANAALFHVPRQQLPRVLRDLWSTLRPAGILFASNPRGQNEEGWNEERYGSYHDLASWRRFVTEAGFTEIAHYYRPPGRPRAQQPWLATVWAKAGSPTSTSSSPQGRRRSSS
jgi:SAM-dependent methyltransferase